MRRMSGGGSASFGGRLNGHAFNLVFLDFFLGSGRHQAGCQIGRTVMNSVWRSCASHPRLHSPQLAAQPDPL